MDNRPVNAIRSMYGIGKPAYWIKHQIEKGKIFKLYNEKEANSFLRTYGYWASMEEEIQLPGDSVHDDGLDVKAKLSDRDADGRELSDLQEQVYAEGLVDAGENMAAEAKKTPPMKVA